MSPPAIACDLAISAVASDAAFVAELIARVAQRLRTTPSWRVESALVAAVSAATIGAVAEAAVDIPLAEDVDVVSFAPSASRVVVVVYHHLWLHDEAMQRDVPMLRERVDEQPTSVCVLSLDATPVPPWLKGAAEYDLMRSGREGVADFVLDAVVAAGGLVNALAQTEAVQPASRWPEPPAPFLSQQRAQSALRHELDALAEGLETIIEESRAAQPDRTFDLQVAPQRLVARLDDVAVTFSWIAGRSASVSDGRLLVIGWRGVAAGLKGLAALRAASVIHERSYAAAGDAPATWKWRSEDSAAHPYSSANLVAEWMARASIARSA